MTSTPDAQLTPPKSFLQQIESSFQSDAPSTVPKRGTSKKEVLVAALHEIGAIEREQIFHDLRRFPETGYKREELLDQSTRVYRRARFLFNRFVDKAAELFCPEDPDLAKSALFKQKPFADNKLL